MATYVPSLFSSTLTVVSSVRLTVELVDRSLFIYTSSWCSATPERIRVGQNPGLCSHRQIRNLALRGRGVFRAVTPDQLWHRRATSVASAEGGRCDQVICRNNLSQIPDWWRSHALGADHGGGSFSLRSPGRSKAS